MYFLTCCTCNSRDQFLSQRSSWSSNYYFFSDNIGSILLVSGIFLISRSREDPSREYGVHPNYTRMDRSTLHSIKYIFHSHDTSAESCKMLDRKTPIAAALNQSISSMSRKSCKARKDGSCSNEIPGIHRRKVQFSKYAVHVMRRMETYGSCHMYMVRGEECRTSRSRGEVDSAMLYNVYFTMRATLVRKKRQAKKAQSRARLLQQVSHHPNIQSLVDIGFCDIQGDITPNKKPEICRMYCELLEHFSYTSSLDYLIQQRTRNRTASLSPAVPSTSGSMFFSTSEVLGIFRQMVEALAFLHQPQKSQLLNLESIDEDKPIRSDLPIIHCNIEPKNFFLSQRAPPDVGKRNCIWHVQLGSFGSAVKGNLSIRTSKDKKQATRLINAETTQNYRSPEMTKLVSPSELTPSTDIWSLGCCLYKMLFLKECFPESESDCTAAITSGNYTIPTNHPYSKDMIYLLSRMLTVDQKYRATIEEVLKYVDYLEQGKAIVVEPHLVPLSGDALLRACEFKPPNTYMISPKPSHSTSSDSSSSSTSGLTSNSNGWGPANPDDFLLGTETVRTFNKLMLGHAVHVSKPNPPTTEPSEKAEPSLLVYLKSIRSNRNLVLDDSDTVSCLTAEFQKKLPALQEDDDTDSQITWWGFANSVEAGDSASVQSKNSIDLYPIPSSKDSEEVDTEKVAQLKNSDFKGEDMKLLQKMSDPASVMYDDEGDDDSSSSSNESFVCSDKSASTKI